ncbi:MAG: filamentous hemagglutinin N-terminal domain-containing protein [Methylococcales bacterium]|nr:filamentous hemagglutinin N-terminal domain-containing protein [Methylococcales bacterium]
MNTSVYAQVITDGSLGSATTLSGQMDIPQSLGTTVGNNLFHSFNTFTINTGESATFTGDNALKNVISRVTGGQVSNINGLLQSTIGTANFYFINPAGVTFGINAQVDVPAAFYMSTADTLRFADGSQFSATNLAANILSIAEPTGFGFLNNQGGNIDVQGSVLDFKDGSVVSLSGHNVTINNGSLTSPSGNIQIYGTGNTITELPLNAPPTTALTGRIELTAASSLDTSGNAGGKITMQGGDIIIKDGSSVTADTLGSGNAGGVFVKSNSLSLLNGGRIGSDTWDTGNAGDIAIEASTLLVDRQGGNQFTGIASNTNNEVIANAGNAGAVSIKADSITVANGGQISSDTWGSGNAGNVAINAASILVNGQGNGAWISSNSNNDLIANAGNAGNVFITASVLGVLNRGQISSDAWGTGNAGAININAGTVFIDGQGSNQFTGIASNTNNDLITNAGNAGTINIKATSLNVVNTGQIVSDTWGSGQAGNIIIDAATISVDGQGNSALISSSSRNAVLANAGNAGTVKLKAHSVAVLNKGQITTLTSGTGNGGNINITAPDITLKDSEITTAATGNVDAGDITINFSHWLTMDSSFIATTANTGNGGTITINGGQLIFLQNSGFLTSVSGANSNGGNINVRADYLVMDTGVIQANAVGGSGGNINLNLKALFFSQSRLTLGGRRVAWRPFVSGLNVIQAASENGVNGAINVTSPQFDISASVSGLDSAQLVMPSIDNSLCQSSAMLGSRLVRGGQGGIPADESQYGFIPLATETATVKPSSIATAKPIILSGGSFPCTNLQP